jgi:signal transduction histidine kinase
MGEASRGLMAGSDGNSDVPEATLVGKRMAIRPLRPMSVRLPGESPKRDLPTWFSYATALPSADSGLAEQRWRMTSGVLRGAEAAFREGKVWWPRLSLAQQFAIIGSVAVVLGSLGIGSWIAHRIERVVVKNAAVATTLYMDRFVSPIVQDLAIENRLSTGAEQSLDDLMQLPAIRMRVSALKIWAKDGELLYSTGKAEIGKRFEINQKLRTAWSGQVTSQFVLPRNEYEAEHANGHQLIEIYAPVKSKHGEIIAVAEFYEPAVHLTEAVTRATHESWLVTALGTLAVVAALFWTAAKRSRVIGEKAYGLERLSVLLNQNETLRAGLQTVSWKAAEEVERVLRRIASDLHDGPVQLTAFALMRMDALCGGDDPQHADERALMRTALKDSHAEIRNLCSGLMMPVETLTPVQALRYVIRRHEERTRTRVSHSLGDLPEQVSPMVKTCLCRVVQEALNNAHRHADGNGQSVEAWCEGEEIAVSVSDRGPGMVSSERRSVSHLGLIGIAERVRNLGGSAEITGNPGAGTRVVVRLPLLDGGKNA